MLTNGLNRCADRMHPLVRIHLRKLVKPSLSSIIAKCNIVLKVLKGAYCDLSLNNDLTPQYISTQGPGFQLPNC